MTTAPDRTASPWREALLLSFIRWTTLLGGIVAVAVGVEMALGDDMRAVWPVVVCMYAGYLVMVLLQFGPRLPLPVRAAGVCVSLVVVAGSAVSLRGPGAGAVMVLAVEVVLASLFFGMPGLIASLAVNAVIVGWLGRTAKLAYSAPATTVGFTCACGALAVIVMFVVRRVEQAHAAAAKAVDELRAEQALREKTQADLARAQATLHQSQKLDAVGRLAAGVAHDFNNTLQVVLGWSHVLSATDDLAEVREGAQQIREAAEHSGSVTRQLLTFSRPELAAPRPLALDEFLGDQVKSYRRLLPNDIAVELQAEPRLSLVADPAQLSQVLLNLVLNARDAMPAGGRLLLGARAVPADRTPPTMAGRVSSAVEISVADTGAGMDEATRARMFEPFFTTKGARGTGLGLATVYGVIHEARGAIEVDSTPGAGTQVRLYFPIAPVATGAEAAPVSLDAAVARALPRVLLVDDEEGVRKSLALALTRAGFTVAEAGDVAGARRILEREGRDIDILVTDGIMAGEKTKDLIAGFLQVRADGRVIICSGYVDEELARRELLGRGLEYLPKPFTPPMLIDRLLGPRRPAGATAG